MDIQFEWYHIISSPSLGRVIFMLDLFKYEETAVFYVAKGWDLDDEGNLIEPDKADVTLEHADNASIGFTHGDRRGWMTKCEEWVLQEELRLSLAREEKKRRLKEEAQQLSEWDLESPNAHDAELTEVYERD